MTSVAYKNSCKQNYFSSWVDLYVEYNECYKKIKNYRSIVNNASSLSEIETLGGIEGDLQEVNFILKNKTLFEFDTVSDEDLKRYMLTDVQKKVLKLRLKYSSCTKIAVILGITPQAVFDIYKQAINKLIKQKKQEQNGITASLSAQQEKIFLSYKEGKKQAEIAKELDISVNSVKTQLKRIKEKLKIVSIQELM